MTILISVGVFVTIVLVIEGLFYALGRSSATKPKQLRRRLQAPGAGSKSKTEPVGIVRQRTHSNMAWMNAILMRLPNLATLERTLEQSNSSIPLGVFLLVSALSACLLFFIATIKQAGLLYALGCGIFGATAPYLFILYKRKRRFAKFQSQLPEALDLVARSLRAGHAFAVGMKMVGEEFADPIGPEFARAVDEISMGIDVPEALRNLTNRIQCVDLKFFVTSLVVQRETGGNLAEILESISRLIRQRFELLGRVKALSAEAKLSAYILFALPFVIGYVLWTMNPEYMGLLFTDPLGLTMLKLGLGQMLLGAYIMKNMVAIKV